MDRGADRCQEVWPEGAPRVVAKLNSACVGEEVLLVGRLCPGAKRADVSPT